MSVNVSLVILFLAVSALYLPLNRRKSRYYWKSRFDLHIPLIPFFVLPYTLFFPFIALTIGALWETRYETSLLIALITAKATTVVFWYFFPNGVVRPEIAAETWLHKLLMLFYRHDKDTNAFPSSHVFMSLLCAYFLALAYPAYALASWSIGVLITLSTIFTKQHHIIDVVGGIGMSVVAVLLVSMGGFPVFD